MSQEPKRLPHFGTRNINVNLIFTKIDAPSKEFVESEKAKGNVVLHIPALKFSKTEISLEIFECDAAFVGSPRAAMIACDALKNFNGSIFTAGEKTAQFLLQQGISVAAAGTLEGDSKNFPEFLRIRKTKKIAWISAQETAADLTKIAEENHVAIQHFPVYKTNAAEIDEEKMQALTHPLIWNFYSGKAVKAMLRFVQKNDAVNLFGASAKKAFEENF